MTAVSKEELETSGEDFSGVELDPYEDDGRSPLWKVAIVFGALACGVIFLLSGVGGDAFVYSKLVNEVMADPESFVGREIRIEGDLVPGSIEFREDPCEWRFVIEKEGHEVPVHFLQCVVPDTFRDGFGISVIAQGELRDDRIFIANEIVPRCPSKYEMQERLEAGEEMPHELPDELPDELPGVGTDPDFERVPDASP